MENKPESPIPYATGGIVKSTLTGVIGCGCGRLGYLIPPKRTQDETVEPYEERESQP